MAHASYFLAFVPLFITAAGYLTGEGTGQLFVRGRGEQVTLQCYVALQRKAVRPYVTPISDEKDYLPIICIIYNLLFLR